MGFFAWLHFERPLEFYGGDYLATLSEQQYCQTVTNSFVAFPMFINFVAGWAPKSTWPFNSFTSSGRCENHCRTTGGQP